MRAVVQRVSQANVVSDGVLTGEIQQGLLVLLGVAQDDSEGDARFLSQKISHLRVFENDDGKMNLSLADVGGAMLVVSQFTLMGDCRKGRRPSFGNAAAPQDAEKLYESFLMLVRQEGIDVQSGRFRTQMQVSLTNDGPVTLILDTDS